MAVILTRRSKKMQLDQDNRKIYHTYVKQKYLTGGNCMMDNRKEVQDSLSAVESVFEITVLMDFYGQLLTERQYEMMDLHYNSDLSLGEIAEELKVSRQAVFDGLRKARQTLENYEKRLGLVERFREQERNIEKALKNLKCLEEKSPELVKDQHYQAAVEILGKLKETL